MVQNQSVPVCLLAIAWIASLFLVFEPNAAGATAAPSVGTWRLVRTPGPRGGPGEISITQSADASRSDIDLAGMMLRCSDNGFDVLVIFLKPYSPRALPKVKLATGGDNTVQLHATVVSPGAAILLPAEAAALVKGSWQTFSELSIEIDDGNDVVRGVISLARLGAALSLLTSSCPLR